MYVGYFFAPKSELIWLLFHCLNASVRNAKGQCIHVFTKDIWITYLTQDMVLIKER